MNDEQILRYINHTPELLSLLYDLNLLPEQLERASPDWMRMLILACWHNERYEAANGMSRRCEVKACAHATESGEKDTLFKPLRLYVSAEVRYWEDATVNGDQDTNGTLIPFRDGILWKPVINLATGRVIDWPEGTTAKIHYKVCDAGEYWLEGEYGRRMKWKGCYVPDDLLCIGDKGYGDYIILKVGADGLIQGWKPRNIDLEEWDAV